MSDGLAIAWTVVCQAPCPGGFPGKNTGVGCHFLLHLCVYSHAFLFHSGISLDEHINLSATCGWLFTLFLVFGNYERSFYKHFGRSLGVDVHVHFLVKYLEVKHLVCKMGGCLSDEKIQTSFQSDCTIFHAHQPVSESLQSPLSSCLLLSSILISPFPSER